MLVLVLLPVLVSQQACLLRWRSVKKEVPKFKSSVTFQAHLVNFYIRHQESKLKKHTNDKQLNVQKVNSVICTIIRKHVEIEERYFSGAFQLKQRKEFKP